MNVDFMRHHAKHFTGSNSPKDHAEIDGLLQEWNLSTDDEQSLASSFAKAMEALLNFDKDQKFKDRPAQIAILLCLWEAIEEYPEIADASFSGSHLSPKKSRLELRIRLASRMFFYGRRVLFNYKNVVDASANFKRSIELFSVDDSDLKSLTDIRASKLLGMRGTTKLFLGRLQPAELHRWLDAYHDLWRSYEFGNKGREATKSLRELALRILDLERTHEGFERFELVSGLGTDDDHQFHSDTSMFHQYRATYFVEQNEPESAVNECERGLERCRAALSESPAPDDEAFSRSTRAFFRQMIIQQSDGIAEEAELKKLNSIIDDLEFSYDFKLGGAGLPLALLRRAFLFKKAENDEKALASLAECLDKLELVQSEEQRDQISRNTRASIADIQIRKAAASDDVATMIALSRDLLKLGNSSWFYLFTIAVNLSNTLKHWTSLDEESHDSATTLVSEFTATFVEAKSVEEDEQLLKSLSLAASYAANASRALDRTQISDETMRLYELALAQDGDANIEIVAFAGNMSLQFAKQLTANGDDHSAVSHFRDAVDRFESAIEEIGSGAEFEQEVLKPVVVYSKLGEAYLRLAKSGERDSALYHEALGNFEKARKLGNDTSELTGLMGDAYYRLGFWGHDPSALKKALELKNLAAAGGNTSRENSSVTGRISEALFAYSKDNKDIIRAVQSIVDALVMDHSWPWPYFQLAEVVSRYPTAMQAFRKLNVDAIPPVLVNILETTASSIPQGLSLKGVERVLENSEFRQLVLGGRSKVFVLDDPHRLISSSIVLKPTKKTDADREIKMANRIGGVLRELGESSLYGVPTPIGTVEVNETDCVYAMRRERGSTLAEKIIGPLGEGYPDDLEALRSAVRLLAIFHRTFPVAKPQFLPSEEIASDLSQMLGRASRSVGLSEAAVNAITQKLPTEIPAVVKKDGHAENWIVGPFGKVVMIDLEAVRKCPVLLDLAQLIEDFPSLQASSEGWAHRYTMIDLYWKELNGGEEPPSFRKELYEFFAIQRAVFGHGFCLRRLKSLESSSSRKALSSRQAHFTSLLKFLSGGGGSGKFASLARECTSKLGK